jgi:CHAD domain-containing protein
MAQGKWIAGLRADMPLAEAGRRVLRARLAVVRKYLRLAMREPESDVEHVHQLRVGTRRAAAALRIFKRCLRRKTLKQMRKVLRRLRKAAGEAREWDVFQEDLAAHLEKAPHSQQFGLQFLLGHAVSCRHAAQARLLRAGKRQQQTLSALVARMKIVRPGKKGRSLGDLARPLLTHLTGKLEKAAQEDLNRYEDLHRVRIAGKRLRYALEVFASCFGPELEDTHYPRVERLQEILGQANDSHTASLRLERMRIELRKRPTIWRPCRPGIEALLRYHQRHLPRLRRAFLQWWRDWRKDGAESLLAALSCP